MDEIITGAAQHLINLYTAYVKETDKTILLGLINDIWVQRKRKTVKELWLYIVDQEMTEGSPHQNHSMSLVHNLARKLADGGPVLPTSDPHVSPRNPSPLQLSAHCAQVQTQVPSHVPPDKPVKFDSRPVTETNPDSIYESPSTLTPSSQEVKTHQDATIVSPPSLPSQTLTPTKLLPTKKSKSPCKKLKSRWKRQT